MTRVVSMMFAGLALLLAPGCATSYAVGAMTHPWGEFEPATSGWVVLDGTGTPQKVVVVTESREHANPNVFLGPGMVLPPGRTGLARVTYDSPDGDGGELEVVDYDVPPGFVAHMYSAVRASPEERDRFKREAPEGGVAFTLVEPGVIEWEGHRFRLARVARRSWGATIGWASLVPVSIAADLALLPFYLGFGIALLVA